MNTLPMISFSFVFLLFCSFNKVSAQTVAQNLSIPALFAYGDSIVDQGTNNVVKTMVKANFPPYGKDFEGGIPTGRFCNGQTPADLIANQYGITNLIPPYLDPHLKPQDLIKGVSFASGGSGFDPQTAQLATVIPLSVQLEQFKEYIVKLKALVGEERANYIIGNALHFVVTGTDDLANTYYTIGIRRKQFDVPSYADLLVSHASRFVQDLTALGARRIGVFSLPPVGCLPSQRTLAGGPHRRCVQNRNEAAQLVNSKLSSELDSLGQRYPQSRIVYIDIYNSLFNLIQNPQSYGFRVNNRGCCGTGLLEVIVLCNKHSGSCPNASEYIFWDSYHPTERGYQVLTNQLLSTYSSRFAF